jgi:hypothetical protein
VGVQREPVRATVRRMSVSGANAKITDAGAAGRIVTVRVGDRAWIAAAANGVCAWHDVPGEFPSEAEAIYAATVVLRNAKATA